jgi:hypothetical protein
MKRRAKKPTHREMSGEGQDPDDGMDSDLSYLPDDFKVRLPSGNTLTGADLKRSRARRLRRRSRN